MNDFLYNESIILNAVSNLNRQEPIKSGFVFAFDEVGRGCIAGDVVAGVSVFYFDSDLGYDGYIDENFKESIASIMSRVKDSKKLTEKARGQIYLDLSNLYGFESSPEKFLFNSSMETSKEIICEMPSQRIIHYKNGSDFTRPRSAGFVDESRSGYLASTSVETTIDVPGNSRFSLFLIDLNLGLATAKEIDLYGITSSVNLACLRAYDNALKKLNNLAPVESIIKQSIIIMDGSESLSFPKKLAPFAQVVIEKGDDRLKSLGLASVIAKVSRDTVMKSLDTNYSQYQFTKHKGYGTKLHYEVLNQYGALPGIHRQSFRLFKK